MKTDYYKKALWLSFFTVLYNIVECIVSILAGVLAGSIALVGFGSDSFVESLSGSIMIWRFRKHGKISEEEEEKIERRATKLVAITFFILGFYILYESVKKLYFQEKPETSIIGILIAIASIIIMPLLFYMKYKVGKKLQSRSLVADSKQALACLFMSISLLIGLLMNYLYGFWQADPIVGLIITAFLFKEGYETIKEEEL
ncbi:MAG: cation diffusion facilitator family transporter [Thermoplasmatales archaeon]|nr:MAG: cation diffusion facilitator family transporter [Thermoplasmatales archaeon]